MLTKPSSASLLLIAAITFIQAMAIYYVSDWSISYCILPGAMWLLFLWTLFRKTEHAITLTAFGVLLTLLFVWLACVGLWSQMANTHYYFFGYMLCWPLIYWTCMLRPELNRAWYLVFFTLSGIALFCSLVLLYQYLILHNMRPGFFPDKNIQSTMANLFVFPMLAYLGILITTKHVNSAAKLAVAVATVLLFLLVTINGSRGATLAAILGLTVFIITLRKQITLKTGLGLIVVAFLPILFGIYFNFHVNEQHSLVTLLHPAKAGADRFVLWQPAWTLIKEHAWFGIGLGNFYWYLPALRLPLDNSAGLYVHNDYLQIWLESGIVGIGLLLGALASLGWLIIKFMHVHKVMDAKKIEVLGLTLGIATVLFYSLFTFTLYVMSILLPLGLYCARIHYLIKDDLSLKVWMFSAVNYTRKRIFYLLGFIIALVLSLYYFSAAATLRLDAMGDEYFAVKDINKAGQYYQYAGLLQPNRMELLISEVEYYNYLDQQLRANQLLEKFMLSNQLNSRFEILTKKYPLYAYAYFLEAEYNVRNRNMADKPSYCMTKQLYQKVLQLWPLSAPAQQSYAGFIKKFGDKPC